MTDPSTDQDRGQGRGEGPEGNMVFSLPMMANVDLSYASWKSTDSQKQIQSNSIVFFHDPPKGQDGQLFLSHLALATAGDGMLD